MPAPHQVKLINGTTGAEALYATYDDARTASSDYDTIQIWADFVVSAESLPVCISKTG